MFTSRAVRGMTLIELIMFIVIVGVALAGVLTVLDVTARANADPVVRKQGLAVAESVLAEVLMQPFTWCDPDDPVAATAASAAGCTPPPAGAVEAIGKETVGGLAESRGSGVTPLDNVSDYNGEVISTSLPGGIAALYPATVTVAAADLNGITAASGDALLVTVSVVAGRETIQVQGYRTRYSPNTLP